MNNDNLFEIEWQNTIQTLVDRNASLNGLDFFFSLGREYSKLFRDKNCPKVVMVGQTFPEEIIRAMGLEYCYVQGGSFESTLYDEVKLPVAADDITKSIVGTLKSESLHLGKEDVVLVPLYNDSMKEIKALISDFTTVICYEVPADKDNPLLQKRFVYEIDRVTKQLEKHFKKRLSKKQIRLQCELSKRAAESFVKFEAACENLAVSDSAYLFIASSYKWTNNKAEWKKHLDALIDEITKNDDLKTSECPGILFFGSPIYAPNYKLLFLIEEIQLRISKFIHPDIEHIKTLQKMDCKLVSIKYLALKYLESDISSAFIKNSVMTDLVIEILKSGKIKGAVGHILKGQIEYDFEYKAIASLFEDYKIPIIRIDTVYNYQNSEQLSLSLETFSEVVR